MQNIDITISEWMNGAARHSWAFDWVVMHVLSTSTMRMLPLAACLIYVWSAAQPDDRGRRAVLDGLAGAFLALVVSRLVQNLMWMRPRPLHDPAVAITPPYTVAPDMLLEWSSFPSDNAALSFAIAAGVALAGRRLGVAAFLWAAVVVCAPRIYGGLHYASDILGGALIGVGAVHLSAALQVGKRLERLAIAVDGRLPGATGALLFLVAFQITTLFDDVRQIATVLFSRL